MGAGNQYPAVSPASLQVVLPLRIEVTVELALVVVLPKNWCRWDAPGWPGKTIGSSAFWWEKLQATRSTPFLAA